jgi:signal peptidase
LAKELIRTLMKSDNFWISLARDLVCAFAVVGAIALGLYMYAGVWPPMVSVDGLSMYPHMQDGDLIIIQGIDKAKIVAYGDAVENGYKSFDGYGDVIVYQPFGRKDMTPVIHRVMYYVNASQPMWRGGIQAPNAGFITKGDNNFLYDQSSGISPNTPVKDEWILGVAKYRIPLFGYVRKALFFIP